RDRPGPVVGDRFDPAVRHECLPVALARAAPTNARGRLPPVGVGPIWTVVVGGAWPPTAVAALRASGSCRRWPGPGARGPRSRVRVPGDLPGRGGVMRPRAPARRG